MNIKFHSPVLITKDIKKLKQFYEEVLKQSVELDFGTCITFQCGLSIWQLNKDQLIAQKLDYTHHKDGNKNLELTFETDSFDETIRALKENKPKLLHDVNIEAWGQRTIRFFDPESNLIEIGETIPSFVKRLHSEGLNIEQLTEKTGVPKHLVEEYVGES